MTERTQQGQLLHISIVQQRLGLSEYQAKRLIVDGKIPASKIGRRTYVLAADLDHYLENFGRAS